VRESQVLVIKRILATKFGWECWYCGLDLTHRTRHLDHIIPTSRGGKNEIDNYALTCKFCNMAKLDHDLEEFYEWLSKVSNRPFKPRIRFDGHHPTSSLYQPDI
jgi:5-methylcytosine-specific restriction endonuclease McrA